MNKGNTTTIVVVIIVIIALVALIWWLITKNTQDKVISEVTYTCQDDKTINATFYNDKANITLSDGRSLSLPQVMSGSDARYANSDESIVFWEKGDTAFVEENNNTTFENCVSR